MLGFLGATTEMGTAALAELASWYNRAFQAVGDDPQYDLTLRTVLEEVRRVEALLYQPAYSVDNYNAQALSIRDKYLPILKPLAQRSVGVIDMIKSAVTSPFEEDVTPAASRAPVARSVAESSLLSRLFSGGFPVPSEFNTTFTSQSVGPAPGTLQQSSSDFVRKWNAYAAEALKLGLPYDVFAKMVDEWSQTNQMDNLTAAESVLAGRRAEIAGASSVAARNIKDNPDALHTQQPGTVAVNAKSYDIGGMLNALLNAAAGGYTEVQRQRLQSKLVQAQIRGDKVHLPASTLPGGGFQTESRIPWGWILLGGAALVLTGVIVFKKRKGGAAASVASVAPAAPMAALPAPK